MINAYKWFDPTIPEKRWKSLVLLFCILLITSSSFAQSVKVTGTVTDEQGQSLPGVTIRVKGSATAAATDIDGKYTISVPSASAVLVFNYIGFLPVERTVGTSTVINVKLQEQSSKLNEVVVIGYGQGPRKDLTGSVGSVNIKDFALAPIKSFDEGLAGRVAGVQVSSNDGQPGSVANIVIRGANSVTQDNSPLYVVDGFPLENASNNSINPGDIESIDILKDASATAIYGARGANGVIIITTKKGKNGPPQVSFNSYYGVQLKPKEVAVLSPYEYVRYMLDLNYNVAASTYLQNGQTLDSYRTKTPLNLQDQLFKTGLQQNYDVAVRGGNNETRYSMSFNLQDQNGVIITSGFKRYQGRVTLDQNLSKKLKAGINANYAYSQSVGAPISNAFGNASLSTLFGAWGYRPTTANDSVTASLGNVLIDPALLNNSYNDQAVNPIIDLKNQFRQNPNTNLLVNAYLEYKITDDLTFRASGGITTNTSEAQSFFNSQTQSGGYPGNATGINGSIVTNSYNNWLTENTLTYNKTFNNNHHLNVVLGATAQKNTSSYRSITSAQIPKDNENMVLDALPFGTSQSVNSYSSRWTLASLLGRVNYNYKSKYYLTASFRTDGSSKFAPGQKFGYFPSGSVAWRMSEEDFFKKLQFVSDAKLRVSYGSTGNNRVSDFAYLPQLLFTSATGSQGQSYGYSYNNGAVSPGVALGALGNYGLKWETTDQFDLGYDLSLIKNRISFTFDYYKKITRDLLLNADLPYTTGLSNGYKNIGKLQNTGLEFSLNTNNIQNKNFTWSSNFNISFPKSKVLALTANQQYLISNVSFTGTYNGVSPYISVVGQPLGQMYGLKWDGVYQYTDFNKLPNGTYQLKPGIPDNGAGRTTQQPGDIKYVDLNGDGTVNARDYTVVGRGLPIHVGGFTNNFTYKQFDLNVLLQWSYGNDILNANRLAFDGPTQYNPYLNQYATYAQRWAPNNSTYESYNSSNVYFRAGGGGTPQYSSRVVEDGSYLRLKTVSLGYTLTPSLLSRLKISSIRIYTSAQNLATWTNYSGPDPEVSVRNSPLTPGFDYSAYPHSRTIVFGFNATF